MKVPALMAVVFLAAAPAVHAELATVQPDIKPYNFVGSVQFDMTSQINGHAYRIFVYTPPVAPPPGGYPVLYVIDGNGTFSVAAGQAYINAIPNRVMMVVGIGYPSESLLAQLNLRHRDLTPSQPVGDQEGLGAVKIKPEDYGEAESFYRFITEEVQPTIAATNKVDLTDQTLYGHSLGGLFTLHVLFHHPNAFRGFVASAPSIWWNNRELLKGEAGFSKAVEAGQTAPRILIEVGGLEESWQKSDTIFKTDAELKAAIASTRMIGNARDLGKRLSKLKGGPGYDARFHVFEGEDHYSGMAASISRALTFAGQH